MEGSTNNNYVCYAIIISVLMKRRKPFVTLSAVFVKMVLPPVCLAVLVGIVSRPILVVDSVSRAFSRAHKPMFFPRVVEWRQAVVAMPVHYRLEPLMVLWWKWFYSVFYEAMAAVESVGFAIPQNLFVNGDFPKLPFVVTCTLEECEFTWWWYMNVNMFLYDRFWCLNRWYDRSRWCHWSFWRNKATMW